MKLRLQHPAWQRLAPLLTKKLFQFYLGTCSVSLKAHPEAEKIMASGAPSILALWHCHLLVPLFFFPALPQGHKYTHGFPATVVMASPSRDGEFIAGVARALGLIVCSGSRQKGGVQALQDIAGYLRQGHRAVVVADGSRGPARVAQKGLVFLSREAQAPLLPLGVASSRKIIFNTWDRFELPLLFSRIRLLVDQPLVVAPHERGAALEKARHTLEARLNALTP
jgi:lysophospholipid acyltransferase (LPLAT)-like uncharacterized protein